MRFKQGLGGGGGGGPADITVYDVIYVYLPSVGTHVYRGDKGRGGPCN